MLAGAIQQLLRAAGLPVVTVSRFGDFTASGPAAIAVHAESDANATLDIEPEVYGARIQIRTRAADQIRAEEAGRQALGILLAADGGSLQWTPPASLGTPARTYRVSAIRVVNRPTWYATATPGEETSCNVRALVEEVG